MSDKGERAFARVVRTQMERTQPLSERLRKCLVKGKRGGYQPIVRNVVTILRMHAEWKGVLVYDDFAKTVVTTRVPPWGPLEMPDKAAPGEWTDGDTARLQTWLSGVGVHIGSTGVIESAVQVVSGAQATNPVQNYFNGLQWDKTKRLDRFAVDYLGAVEDNEYARLVGRKWMISVIARAMDPGCQVDNTLILESPTQGELKSSALRALVPVESWFGDTPIEIGNKDSYQALRGKLIYCLDELDSTRRAENTKVKSFLTSRIDTYRPSYGRRTQDFKRQCVFCGSTNEEFYLPDRTGNRRYLPLRIKRALVKKIIRDRDQLWAEAVAAYKNKETWWDDTEAFRKLCRIEQADRELPDDWLPLVAAYVKRYDRGPGVLTTDVLRHSELALQPSQIHSGHTQRCAAVLRTLGYVRGPRSQKDGERARLFRLPNVSQRNAIRAERRKRRSRLEQEKRDAELAQVRRDAH